MHTVPSEQSLSAIGRQIYSRFDLVKRHIDAENSRGISAEILEEKAQAFALWAVNLGLYHDGHASLDYRFRDAPSIWSFTRRLLKNMDKSLSLSMNKIPNM